MESCFSLGCLCRWVAPDRILDFNDYAKTSARALRNCARNEGTTAVSRFGTHAPPGGQQLIDQACGSSNRTPRIQFIIGLNSTTCVNTRWASVITVPLSS